MNDRQSDHGHLRASDRTYSWPSILAAIPTTSLSGAPCRAEKHCATSRGRRLLDPRNRVTAADSCHPGNSVRADAAGYCLACGPGCYKHLCPPGLAVGSLDSVLSSSPSLPSPVAADPQQRRATRTSRASGKGSGSGRRVLKQAVPAELHVAKRRHRVGSAWFSRKAVPLSKGMLRWLAPLSTARVLSAEPECSRSPDPGVSS